MATGKPPLSEMGSLAAMFHIGEKRPMPALPDKCSKYAKAFTRQCLT